MKTVANPWQGATVEIWFRAYRLVTLGEVSQYQCPIRHVS